MVKTAMDIDDDTLRQLRSHTSVILSVQTLLMKRGRIARKHEDLPPKTRERLHNENVQQKLIQIAREDCEKRGLKIPDPFFEQLVRYLYRLDSLTDSNSEAT